MEIPVKLYGCENEKCNLIFGAQLHGKIVICPQCKGEVGEVGQGTIKSISEH